MTEASWLYICEFNKSFFGVNQPQSILKIINTHIKKNKDLSSDINLQYVPLMVIVIKSFEIRVTIPNNKYH